MSEDEKVAWVAFNAHDQPCGFANIEKGIDTIAKAAKEFPWASRIEAVTETRRKALLAEMIERLEARPQT